jgi:hypothetical protein
LTRGCGAAPAGSSSGGGGSGGGDVGRLRLRQVVHGSVMDKRGVEGGICARLDLMERLRNLQHAESFCIKNRERHKTQVDLHYFLAMPLLF